MAKDEVKKKKAHDPYEDNFSVDDDWGSDEKWDDFDSSFDDIDVPKGKKSGKRKPQSVLGTYGTDALKGTTLGVATGLRDNILAGVPNIKQLADEATGFVDDFANIKQELLRSGGQMTTQLKQISKALTPTLSRILPSGLKKKLEEFNKTEDTDSGYREKSIEEQRKSFIDEEVAGVLKLQVAQQQEEATERRVNEAIDKKITAKRHKETTEIIESLRQEASWQTEFYKSVATGYFTKSLELKYQHLFVTKDILASLQTGFKSFDSKLDGILKNTGLPDIQKKFLSESFKETARGALIKKASDKLTGKASGILSKFASKFKEKYNDALDQVGGAIDSLAMAADMASSMEDMGSMGGPSMGSMMADMGGNIFGQFISSFMSPETAKKIVQLTGAGSLNHKFRNLQKNVALKVAHANKYGQEQINEDDTTWQKFYKFLKNTALSAADDTLNGTQRAENLLVKKPTDPTSFDIMTRQSIVEIIPRYLAKILQQVTTLNTGKPAEELVFNEHTRDLTTAKEYMKENWQRYVADRVDKNGNKQYSGDAYSTASSVLASGLTIHATSSAHKVANAQSLEDARKDLDIVLNNFASGIVGDLRPRWIKEYVDNKNNPDWIESDWEIKSYIKNLLTNVQEKNKDTVLQILANAFINPDGKENSKAIADFKSAIFALQEEDGFVDALNRSVSSGKSWIYKQAGFFKQDANDNSGDMVVDTKSINEMKRERYDRDINTKDTIEKYKKAVKEFREYEQGITGEEIAEIIPTKLLRGLVKKLFKDETLKKHYLTHKVFNKHADFTDNIFDQSIPEYKKLTTKQEELTNKLDKFLSASPEQISSQKKPTVSAGNIDTVQLLAPTGTIKSEVVATKGEHVLSHYFEKVLDFLPRLETTTDKSQQTKSTVTDKEDLPTKRHTESIGVLTEIKDILTQQMVKFDEWRQQFQAMSIAQMETARVIGGGEIDKSAWSAMWKAVGGIGRGIGGIASGVGSVAGANSKGLWNFATSVTVPALNVMAKIIPGLATGTGMAVGGGLKGAGFALGGLYRGLFGAANGGTSLMSKLLPFVTNTVGSTISTSKDLLFGKGTLRERIGRTKDRIKAGYKDTFTTAKGELLDRLGTFWHNDEWVKKGQEILQAKKEAASGMYNTAKEQAAELYDKGKDIVSGAANTLIDKGKGLYADTRERVGGLLSQFDTEEMQKKFKHVKAIYSANKDVPLLTIQDLAKGVYCRTKKGKDILVKKIEDITGPIYDEQGNLLVSLDDIKSGLFTDSGQALINYSKQFKNYVEKNVKGFAKRVSEDPKLQAAAAKAAQLGEKFRDANFGTVKEQAGNLVNTAKDKITGFVDTAKNSQVVQQSQAKLNQMKEEAGGWGGLIPFLFNKVLAPGVSSTVKNMFGAPGTLTNRLGHMGLSALEFGGKTAGNMLNRLFGFEKKDKNGKPIPIGIDKEDLEHYVTSRLDEIIKVLYDIRPNKVVGDTDNDGDREGSYQDYMQKQTERKKALEAKRAALVADKDKNKKDKTTDDDDSGFLGTILALFGGKALLGKFNNLRKSLFGGIGRLLKLLVNPKSILALLAALFGSTFFSSDAKAADGSENGSLNVKNVIKDSVLEVAKEHAGLIAGIGGLVAAKKYMNYRAAKQAALAGGGTAIAGEAATAAAKGGSKLGKLAKGIFSPKKLLGLAAVGGLMNLIGDDDKDKDKDEKPTDPRTTQFNDSVREALGIKDKDESILGSISNSVLDTAKDNAGYLGTLGTAFGLRKYLQHQQAKAAEAATTATIKPTVEAKPHTTKPNVRSRTTAARMARLQASIEAANSAITNTGSKLTSGIKAGTAAGESTLVKALTSLKDKLPKNWGKYVDIVIQRAPEISKKIGPDALKKLGAKLLTGPLWLLWAAAEGTYEFGKAMYDPHTTIGVSPKVDISIADRTLIAIAAGIHGALAGMLIGVGSVVLSVLGIDVVWFAEAFGVDVKNYREEQLDESKKKMQEQIEKAAELKKQQQEADKAANAGYSIDMYGGGDTNAEEKKMEQKVQEEQGMLSKAWNSVTGFFGFDDSNKNEAKPNVDLTKVYASPQERAASIDRLNTPGAYNQQTANIDLSGGMGMTPNIASAGAPVGNETAGSLGNHVKQFESGKEGSSKIGYDGTGGTSYGTYQFASKPGGTKAFLVWVAKNGGEFGRQLAQEMFAAGPLNTGSRKGAPVDVWKKYAAVNGGKTLHDLEKRFVYEHEYLSSLNRLKVPGLKEFIQGNRGLQEAYWSTVVQHGAGGAASIFRKAYQQGISPQDMLKRVYAIRSTKFPSSTADVRRSVQNRFKKELAITLGLAGQKGIDTNNKSGNDSSTSQFNMGIDNSGQSVSQPNVSGSGVIARAIQAAFAQATPTAKYDQDRRTEPNIYDCSSFVSRAYNAAGLSLGVPDTNGVREQFPNKGFTWIPGNPAKKKDQLQPGDLLIHSKKESPDGRGHVEMWLGNNKIIGARNTKPNPSGVGVVDFWNDGYNGVLRYTGGDAGSANVNAATASPNVNTDSGTIDTPASTGTPAASTANTPNIANNSNINTGSSAATSFSSTGSTSTPTSTATGTSAANAVADVAASKTAIPSTDAGTVDMSSITGAVSDISKSTEDTGSTSTANTSASNTPVDTDESISESSTTGNKDLTKEVEAELAQMGNFNTEKSDEKSNMFGDAKSKIMNSTNLLGNVTSEANKTHDYASEIDMSKINDMSIHELKMDALNRAKNPYSKNTDEQRAKFQDLTDRIETLQKRVSNETQFGKLTDEHKAEYAKFYNELKQLQQPEQLDWAMHKANKAIKNTSDYAQQQTKFIKNNPIDENWSIDKIYNEKVRANDLVFDDSLSQEERDKWRKRVEELSALEQRKNNEIKAVEANKEQAKDKTADLAGIFNKNKAATTVNGNVDSLKDAIASSTNTNDKAESEGTYSDAMEKIIAKEQAKDKTETEAGTVKPEDAAKAAGIDTAQKTEQSKAKSEKKSMSLDKAKKIAMSKIPAKKQETPPTETPNLPAVATDNSPAPVNTNMFSSVGNNVKSIFNDIFGITPTPLADATQSTNTNASMNMSVVPAGNQSTNMPMEASTDYTASGTNIQSTPVISGSSTDISPITSLLSSMLDVLTNMSQHTAHLDKLDSIAANQNNMIAAANQTTTPVVQQTAPAVVPTVNIPNQTPSRPITGRVMDVGIKQKAVPQFI